jgi:hypothetical protein
VLFMCICIFWALRDVFYVIFWLICGRYVLYLSGFLSWCILVVYLLFFAVLFGR